jgi:glyoxylase I family protein
MNRTRDQQSTKPRAGASREQGIAVEFHGVRYQVKDVSRAVDFYTKQLGFKLDHQVLPMFANVSIEHLTIHLSGPGASGSRPMPDGRRQEPGGWNRVVLGVTDLSARIETLRAAGLRFRNEMEVGPAGRQIQLEDPDGNAIELFEPASEGQRKSP